MDCYSHFVDGKTEVVQGRDWVGHEGIGVRNKFRGGWNSLAFSLHFTSQ